MDFPPTWVHCKSCIASLCLRVSSGNGPNTLFDSNMTAYNPLLGTDSYLETAKLPPRIPMICPMWHCCCCWKCRQNYRLTGEKTLKIDSQRFYRFTSLFNILWNSKSFVLSLNTVTEVQWKQLRGKKKLSVSIEENKISTWFWQFRFSFHNFIQNKWIFIINKFLFQYFLPRCQTFFTNLRTNIQKSKQLERELSKLYEWFV